MPREGAEPRSGGGCWAYTLELAVEDAEQLVAELWSAGCRGLQELEPATRDDDHCGDLRVVAYFDSEVTSEIESLASSLRARLAASERVPATDWLAEYRRRAQPFAIGRRWWLDPRDPSADASTPAPGDPSGDGRRVLRVPARRAFGTGSHATTALVLELLEDRQGLAGSRVLDVGCGSGILSLAALALGGAPVAFDLDPTAAAMARINAALNRVSFPLFAGSIRALSASARFDLVVVNVLPENLLGQEPEIAAVVASGGQVLLSGILKERREEVARRWRRLGFSERESASLEEWTALVLERAQS